MASIADDGAKERLFAFRVLDSAIGFSDATHIVDNSLHLSIERVL